MKRFTGLLILVLIAGFPVKSFSQNGKPDDAALAILTKFRSAYSSGLTQRKPELFTSYFAENIRVVPEFQKTMIGKANALAYHKSFAARFQIRSFTRNKNEVINMGKQILETGMFEMTLSLSSSGPAQSVIGKYFTLWEVSSSGITVITDAWNYNQGLDFEEQLRFPEIPTVEVATQAHLPVNDNIRFELAALNALMENTVTQHDAKIWTQFYADDGAFFYSRQPASNGKSALAAFFNEHVKGLPVFEKLDIRNDRIDDLGSYIVEYASHIAIVRSGDFSGVFTGKDLVVWRREANGSLKIFRHIALYD